MNILYIRMPKAQFDADAFNDCNAMQQAYIPGSSLNPNIKKDGSEVMVAVPNADPTWLASKSWASEVTGYWTSSTIPYQIVTSPEWSDPPPDPLRGDGSAGA